MKDYLFRGSLRELDAGVDQLIQLESERQYRKLILIPSESTAPKAVREALGSVFQNIYAEGYPDDDSRIFSEEQILNYEERLAHFRRYSDPRYYKGVEYVDILEMLARRRCAELFSTDKVSADEIFVNVQPLSGAPANNAVYHALLNPGETIMGMNLLHGGHLSHGSPVNRSGKYYNAVHYTVDETSEQINYDDIEELARKHKPNIIVAGYSSYPWSVDWSRFKEIASSVGAYLLADIAHVAGLVVAGVYPSPIGFADVVTFTTHKSLCGPRGACILTTQNQLTKKLDRAVFPGEQGGPHTNAFAGMAVAFKLAKTQQFRDLQDQIVKNCIIFTDRLKNLGFRIPFGGTNTHLMNLDCSALKGMDGTGLSGDQAARILDIAGIVVNRNTIPRDTSAVDPSGIRMGTPWVTQRGFKEQEIIQLADIIGDILNNIEAYQQSSNKGIVRRAKIKFDVLESSKEKVRELAESSGIDIKVARNTYPHFYYISDTFQSHDNCVVFDIKGKRIRQFLDFSLSLDISELSLGDSFPTCIHTTKGTIEGTISCKAEYHFLLSVPIWQAALTASWLRDLSDGYIHLEEGKDIVGSILMKLPGPVVIKEALKKHKDTKCKEQVRLNCEHYSFKPYFIGIKQNDGEQLMEFSWGKKHNDIRRTPLYRDHIKLGAKMITDAGWEMPAYYTSVSKEHQATRQKAGLFDISHMGIFQAEGCNAISFLDCVCANDIGALNVGESCYTHMLDSNANVIDDLMVYRLTVEKIMLVVNALNNEKDWAWLNAVKEGTVRIDNRRPWAKIFGRHVVLRDLRSKESKDEMKLGIALQGPASMDIILSIISEHEYKNKILILKRGQLCEVSFNNCNMIVSRTGYSGEKMGFELFIHPDNVSDLFLRLLGAGEHMGLQTAGIAARDSLRIEAGLPLYGHELGCDSGKGRTPDLGVGEAGFTSHVKTYKPWFIGRDSFILREQIRESEIIRFSVQERDNNMVEPGDYVSDISGQIVGWVTGCTNICDIGLVGQAYILKSHAELGNQMYINRKTGDQKIEIGERIRSDEKNIKTISIEVIKRFL